MNTPRPNLSLACSDSRFLLQADQPKPDFLLIGGAKCGTTSFSAYFPAHPQVAPWVVKEPNYWSWKRPTTQQYQALFRNVNPSQPGPEDEIAGDYSTSSLIHPLVPRRVRASLPDVKIIVMLRNPIDRAYSHYVMSQRSGLEKEQSFDAIVRREIEQATQLLEAHERGFLDPSGELGPCCQDSAGNFLNFPVHNRNWTARPLKLDIDLQAFYFTSYVFRSIYHDQLSRWLRLYPKEQFLIIQSERFFAEPARHMADAARFMGLQDFDFSKTDELKRRYAGSAAGDWAPPEKYQAMDKSTRKLLRTFFQPHNKKLYSLIGEDYGWK